MILFHRASQVRLVWLAIALVLLSGCSVIDYLNRDETEDWTAQQLSDAAREAVLSGNYETAVDYLEKLESRYPFGRYARNAELQLIYTYYKSGQPDQAIAAADRFIRTYPRSDDLDYVYYMKGLVNFNRGDGPLDRLFPNDPSLTDTDTSRKAFTSFSELVRLFPNSQYAEDARQRLRYLHYALARHEANVADYYWRRGAYVAAVNRSDTILQRYAQTPAVEQALAIMVKSYMAMGANDLAKDALQVLQLNYPQHPNLVKWQGHLNPS